MFLIMCMLVDKLDRANHSGRIDDIMLLGMLACWLLARCLSHVVEVNFLVVEKQNGCNVTVTPCDDLSFPTKCH
jgi:hypothetical protein